VQNETCFFLDNPLQYGVSRRFALYSLISLGTLRTLFCLLYDSLFSTMFFLAKNDSVTTIPQPQSDADIPAQGQAMAEWFSKIDLSTCEHVVAHIPSRHPDVEHEMLVCTDPDVPPCDACGKMFSGNLTCNSCHSAFYCSKVCQKKSWKQGGHKQLCDGMKEKCVLDAKRVVEALTTRSIAQCANMEEDVGNIMGLLDGNGAFKAAVAEGLYEVVREAFQHEKETIVERFRANKDKELWVTSRAILCHLFRGHRAEGRALKNDQMDYVDGQRIKAYINSHPDAFDVWMDASLATFRLPFETLVWRRRGGSSNDQYNFAYQAARDILALWTLVLTSKRASRAILFPAVSDDDSKEAASRASILRVGQIADRLREAVQLAVRFGKRDPGRVIEAETHNVAGMMSCRVKEFQIDFDFDSRLDLSSFAGMSYQNLIKPMCQAAIDKGCQLSNEESMAAVAAHAEKMKEKL
jgi:hypothetical protein